MDKINLASKHCEKLQRGKYQNLGMKCFIHLELWERDLGHWLKGIALLGKTDGLSEEKRSIFLIPFYLIFF